MSSRTYFCGSIFLFWLALPVLAQSVFTVTPSQVPGVQLYGPETPEFVQHLSDLRVDAKGNNATAAILSRAIVVTNATDRPVTKFLVRFDYLNPAGKMYAESQWLEPPERFEPGTSRLITVSTTLTEGIRSKWPEQTMLQATNGSMSAAIIGSPLIRVSLDSVLFADGDFFGPDVSGAWGMLVEEQEFVRAMRIKLEQAGANLVQIQQMLDEINKPIVDRKKIPGEGLRVTLMRYRMFGDLTGALNRGYEAFRAVLQARFGESVVLRRRL